MGKPMEISEIKAYQNPVDGFSNKINDLEENRSCPISREKIDSK